LFAENELFLFPKHLNPLAWSVSLVFHCKKKVTFIKRKLAQELT
jgi:hypothetical protein